MVLTDDNFVSIVSAVEEGRGIYDNIRKVLQYLLSCNVGEILLVLLASLLGWPAPLLPVQLLWINLITDGLPALALALEAPEPGVMSRKPRPPDEPVLTWFHASSILGQGMLVGLVSLSAFAILHVRNPDDLASARTAAFCVLAFAELFRAFAARSQSLGFHEVNFFSNPWLLGAIGLSATLQIGAVTLPGVRSLFDVDLLAPNDWMWMLALALVPVIAIEALKALGRWRGADS